MCSNCIIIERRQNAVVRAMGAVAIAVVALALDAGAAGQEDIFVGVLEEMALRVAFRHDQEGWKALPQTNDFATRVAFEWTD
jgi:hypothetical protein